MRPLSPRLQQVAQLMCDGYSNAEIGMELSLSRASIKNYAHLIGLHMGETDRVRLIILCFEAGIADGSTRHPLPDMRPSYRRIAVAMLKGSTYAEIASLFAIAVATVKNVTQEIFEVCGVWSQSELVSRYTA